MGFSIVLKVFKLLRYLKDCRKVIFRNTSFLVLILLRYSCYCHIGETNHFFMSTLVFFLLRCFIQDCTGEFKFSRIKDINVHLIFTGGVSIITNTQTLPLTIISVLIQIKIAIYWDLSG